MTRANKDQSENKLRIKKDDGSLNKRKKPVK